jgi:hypothetical protein
MISEKSIVSSEGRSGRVGGACGKLVFIESFRTGTSGGTIVSRDGRSGRVGGTWGELRPETFLFPDVLFELDRLLLLLQSLLMLRTVIKGFFILGLTAGDTSSPTMVIESAEKRLVAAEGPFPWEAKVVSSSATGSKGLDT